MIQFLGSSPSVTSRAVRTVRAARDTPEGAIVVVTPFLRPVE